MSLVSTAGINSDSGLSADAGVLSTAGISTDITSTIPAGAIAYWNTSTDNTNTNVLLDMVGGSDELVTTRAGTVNAVYDSVLTSYANNVVALTDAGALIQKAATNYTKDDDLTGWTDSGTTRTIADLTEAGLVFTKVTETTANGAHYVFQGLGAFPSGSDSCSVYIKKGTSRYCFIELYMINTDLYTSVIDLDTQTQVGFRQVGTNFTNTTLQVDQITADIYRYTLRSDKGAGDIRLSSIGLSDSASPTYNSSGVPTYTGVATNTVYFASVNTYNEYYPSSPIDDTVGTTSARIADVATIPLSTFSKVNDFTLTLRIKFEEHFVGTSIWWEKTALYGYFAEVSELPSIGFTKDTAATPTVTLSTMGNIAGRTFDMTYIQSSTNGMTLSIDEVGGSSYSDSGTNTTSDGKADITAWGSTANLMQRATGAGSINGKIISILFK